MNNKSLKYKPRSVNAEQKTTPPKHTIDEVANELVSIIESHLKTMTPIERQRREKAFDEFMERFKGH